MPSTLGLITKRRTRNASGTYPKIDTITGTSYSKDLSGYPDEDLFLFPSTTSQGFISVGNTDESTGLSWYNNFFVSWQSSAQSSYSSKYTVFYIPKLLKNDFENFNLSDYINNTSIYPKPGTAPTDWTKVNIDWVQTKYTSVDLKHPFGRRDYEHPGPNYIPSMPSTARKIPIGTRDLPADTGSQFYVTVQGFGPVYYLKHLNEGYMGKLLVWVVMDSRDGGSISSQPVVFDVKTSPQHTPNFWPGWTNSQDAINSGIEYWKPTGYEPTLVACNNLYPDKSTGVGVWTVYIRITLQCDSIAQYPLYDQTLNLRESKSYTTGGKYNYTIPFFSKPLSYLPTSHNGKYAYATLQWYWGGGGTNLDTEYDGDGVSDGTMSSHIWVTVVNPLGESGFQQNPIRITEKNLAKAWVRNPPI